MKNKILQYLKTDRGFETGLALYMQFGNSESFKRILNRQGFSDYNHKLLHEELRKVAELKEDELAFILSVPIAMKSNPESNPEALEGLEATNPPNAKEVKVFVHELPEYVRKSIKLRDEFPFLRDKDCPDALKILVADMISAFEAYHQAHEQLFGAMKPDDFAKATEDVVENYLENRAIWDELNHYKEHKTLLGVHPIFDALNRFEEIRKMNGTELVKLIKSLENNISRNVKLINDKPEHPQTHNRKERVEKYQQELAEVRKIVEAR